jgi:hypothetical protein
LGIDQRQIVPQGRGKGQVYLGHLNPFNHFDQRVFGNAIPKNRLVKGDKAGQAFLDIFLGVGPRGESLGY